MRRRQHQLIIRLLRRQHMRLSRRPLIIRRAIRGLLTILSSER